MRESDLIRWFQLFDITAKPNHLALYQQAFIHTSYVGTNPKVLAAGVIPLVSHINQTNQRLEFRGDAALGDVVASYLCDRFDEKDEGFMTKIKSKLVRTRYLNYFARKLGFEKYMWISLNQESDTKGRTYNKTMEDAFEAFIGAIKKDLGYSVVEQFICGLLDQYVDWTDIIRLNFNYKHQFLEHCQDQLKKQPRWHLEPLEGAPADPIYVVSVTDNMGNVIGRGKGKLKLEAEHEASKNALTNLGVYVADKIELHLSLDPRLSSKTIELHRPVKSKPRKPIRMSLKHPCK